MKRKGFTLIEMLIVVAIIGILAALLIPNAMSALQKAKQKGTVKDINTLATALMDYVTDKGGFIGSTMVIGRPLTDNDSFVAALQGFYLKTFPVRDQWGNFFEVYTGAQAYTNNWNVQDPNATETPDDEFVVGSNGRNGSPGDINYDPTNPSASLYEVTKMADFNNEIVNWNGSLVIGPRTAAGTGT